ncbi:hypothetical protein [Bacillus amyloliquefaciens]|uniref:hypothetical protein n=1 Tax=Bacillus amyloliquefaciens group TaxID=1938374 RepID=UPI001268B139|nr:hypothetical protein [Bacillus amyloliquefaciens]QPV72641.1 hypothetical protein I8N72_12560 [Bacillus velezensis]
MTKELFAKFVERLTGAVSTEHKKSDPAHQQCRSLDLLPITIIPYLKQNGVPLSCHLSAKIFLVHSFLLCRSHPAHPFITWYRSIKPCLSVLTLSLLRLYSCRSPPVTR